jgi:glycosyltransferase involved in cell wall biosynthesis
MNVPLVSVVMSVFNAEPFLPACVHSILSQTYAELEFIVIDDGSTDGSSDLLAAYAASDRRIRVQHQENAGLVAGLRCGCDFASGVYIARMDADDIAVTDRLARQVAFLESHPEVGVLGGAAECIDAHGNSLGVVRNPCHDAEIQRELQDRNVFWHPSVMMRRAHYVQSGGYRNVRDAEDYDLWLRMAEICEMGNLKETILRYRIHSQQSSILRSRKQALGTLVSQLSARARSTGIPDPFLDTKDPLGLLCDHGVSEKEIQSAVARAYLSCLRNMYRAGDYTRSVEIFGLLRSPECELAHKWIRSDACLWMAKADWKAGNYRHSIANACLALLIRPAILGRLLKPFSNWLRSVSVAGLIPDRNG